MRFSTKGKALRVTFDSPAVAVSVLNCEMVPLRVTFYGTQESKHTVVVEGSERVSLDCSTFPRWQFAEMVSYAVVYGEQFPRVPEFTLETGRHVGVPDGFTVY